MSEWLNSAMGTRLHTTKLEADDDLPPQAFTRMSRPMLWRVFGLVFSVFPLGLVGAYLAPTTRQAMPELTLGWGFGWLALLAVIALFMVGILVWLFQEFRVSMKSGRVVAWQGFVRKTIQCSDIQRVEMVIDQRSKMDGVWLRIIGSDRYFEFSGLGDENVGPVLQDLAEVLAFEWIEAEREATARLDDNNFDDWRANIYSAAASQSLPCTASPHLARGARRHDANVEAALSVMFILPPIACLLISAVTLGTIFSQYEIDSFWLLAMGAVPAAVQFALFDRSLNRRARRGGLASRLGHSVFWAVLIGSAAVFTARSALTVTITSIVAGSVAYAYWMLTQALINWAGGRSSSLWVAYHDNLTSEVERNN